MKTTLRAPVPLVAVSVLAEVAVWEPRLELQRLCKSAEASGRLDEALVASALPGMSGSACRNLLRTTQYLRLIEAGGALSDFGKRCVLTGEAPAWELGVFTFLVARHPSFGAWPVGFRRDRAEGQDREFKTLEGLPTWFAPTPRRVWVSGFEDRAKFTISAFPAPPGQNPAVRTQDEPPATLVWELDLSTGKNLLHLEGNLEGSGKLNTVNMTVPEHEVAALFGKWEPRWHAQSGRMLTAYDGGADKQGRDSFVRDLSYPKVSAEPRGTFEGVVVQEVPVGPSSPREAHDWALTLLLNRVGSANELVAPGAWRRGWDQVITGTPLQAGAGAPPEPLALVEQPGALSPRLRWLLAAPADLSLE